MARNCFCLLLLLFLDCLHGKRNPTERTQLKTHLKQFERIFHPGNCSLQNLEEILRFALNQNRDSHTLWTTPCLSSQSFGNFLSDYVESRVCAHLSGLHLISLVNQTLADLPSYIPKIVRHHSPQLHGLANAKKICTCFSICHENPYALLHSHPPLVRNVLRPLILKHHSKNMKRVSSSDRISPFIFKSSLRQPYDTAKPIFPTIPDAAIHYRCGDNTVGHYGFLAFPAFLHAIPLNTSTIYVLAEKSSRSFTPRRAERCDAVLSGLWIYLTKSFPSSTVLVLRGAAIFDDFSRLGLAQITVCSVSTFCFYAALASSGEAYLPITRLFAKATTPDYGSHVKWLDSFPADSVIHGGQILSLSDDELVHNLVLPQGARQTPPSYINLSKRPVPKYVVPK
jgi:hypothetical protein